MNQKAKLIIEWGGPGTQVLVNGPIADKALCYAMLECAKDAIREYTDKHQSRIVVPDLDMMKGNGA